MASKIYKQTKPSSAVNKLLLTIALQRYYKREHRRGLTAVRIWENVRNLVPMNRSTFYNYLNAPAAVKLTQTGADIKEFEPRIGIYIETIDRLAELN